MNKIKTLIAFEGHDGVGKTTLMNLLKLELQKKGYVVKYFYSLPDKFNDMRKRIDLFNDLELSFWFYTIGDLMAVNNALEDNCEILLFDRYIYSTLVSHIARGLKINDEKILNFFPIPDMTFYINVDRNELCRRVFLRNDIESNDLEIVQNGKLLDVAEKLYGQYSMIYIDNNGNIEKAYSEILLHIEEYLLRNRSG